MRIYTKKNKWDREKKKKCIVRSETKPDELKDKKTKRTAEKILVPAVFIYFLSNKNFWYLIIFLPFSVFIVLNEVG